MVNQIDSRSYRQRYGIDCNETFAPVFRYDTLRILLSIATQEDLQIAQFDVKKAFLYGKLEDKINMKVPEGISTPKGFVCKLDKLLYIDIKKHRDAGVNVL